MLRNCCDCYGHVSASSVGQLIHSKCLMYTTWHVIATFNLSCMHLWFILEGVLCYLLLTPPITPLSANCCLTADLHWLQTPSVKAGICLRLNLCWRYFLCFLTSYSTYRLLISRQSQILLLHCHTFLSSCIPKVWLWGGTRLGLASQVGHHTAHGL